MAEFFQFGPESGGSRQFRRALDTVQKMEELDLFVVPRTPSREMIEAGARAGGISLEYAEKIFRAMVLAAR
jgi:hypothetical protein